VQDVQENKFIVLALNLLLAEDKLKNAVLNMDAKRRAKEEKTHIAARLQIDMHK